MKTMRLEVWLKVAGIAAPNSGMSGAEPGAAHFVPD
jgi:hypothetical protein